MTGNLQQHGAELLPWTRLVTPHSDIVDGKLSMDTYAVNLDLVVQNSPTIHPVYRDARAFFEATYLTQELRRILTDVMGVLADRGGDRVLQLRTPFGGGKTHTLLALYHLAHARALLTDLPDLAKLPDPGPVRIAVISGVQQGAADRSSRRRRTLWGELAQQLGGDEAYALVAEQDRQGIAPGGEILSQVIGQEPTLLLLDEMLSYVENAQGVVVGESTLGRQTITFLQRLTETIASAPHAALVYSLQASEQEAGGNQELLGILGKIVQRVTATREPVSGDEVLRIVQRRLFADLGDQQQRERVARTYADAYLSYVLAGGTPRSEAHHQAEQLHERILLSYPFHPSLLDLMRERWSALPSYQRTRGALQFLATAVHALWSENIQAQPLLSAGDIPLLNEAARNSFFDQVGERDQYYAVLQADLIGPNAGARAVDQLHIRESPHLQAYLPGTRIATAALLYSFGGSSQIERGVFETELLTSCLAPGLDRNILQTALHDLNERLLYLHRRELRYRFETQPNLNKMIIDEKQRRSEEEIEKRLRSEFSKRLGNERDAVIWPDEPLKVRDRLEEHQVVYLSPMWLEANPDPEKREREKRRYIEECGNVPRQYRNGLTLAVPDERMVQEAQNAVRMLLTLELLQSQSAQRQFTTQQNAELAERKGKAEGELQGCFSNLYPTVYTPKYSEQAGQTYTFEPLSVQSYSQAPQIHARIKDALNNRVVWGSIQPSKLASLTRLNEQEEMEKQYYPVAALVSGFFRYYNWTHIWNAEAIRQAISIGVRNRTFAYATNVRKDSQEHLIFNGSVVNGIYFGKELAPHNIDTGENTYIISASYAQQLLTPPTPPTVEPEPAPRASASTPTPYAPTPSSAHGVSEPAAPLTATPVPGKPVAPGQGGQHYRFSLHSNNLGDLYEIQQALERLQQRAEKISITINVLATSQPNQPFQRNTLHNLIIEPITEETSAEILDERVEE